MSKQIIAEMLQERVEKFVKDFMAEKEKISAATMNDDVSTRDYSLMYAELVGMTTARVAEIKGILELKE